ncbi:MAG: alpha/beta hydrolase [Bacteroidota bacterium]
MKRFILPTVFLFATFVCQSQTGKEIIDFQFEGVTINGILNFPKNTRPKGIVMIVHGSGSTNAVAQEWHLDIRESIIKAGYATYMWDKMGCGKSGGTFNYNQSVQSSASEVLAAIEALKKRGIAGADKIGLWGISRAGWINPIVINQYKNIKFWISVSGVDEKENFNYLLKQNLRINGMPKDSIDLIIEELITGAKISHAGGSFEEYMKATSHLRANKFWSRFTNGGITEEGYYSFQPVFMKEELDKKDGLKVYIKNFASILSNVDCPVLAFFGEKDMNVDWEKTKSLYEQTLARNTDLTVKSFPDCNHNIFKCFTGGFYEFQDNNLPWTRCDGFLDTMTTWLNNLK